MSHTSLGVGLGASRPTVRDTKSCERWLASTPLADPQQACYELISLLEALSEQAPPPKGYLEVLERLREPVHIAADESAKRFASKQLPLNESETASFNQFDDLWTTFGRGYRELALA